MSKLKVVQYRFCSKIQKLQLYYTTNFKIQNVFALHLHKCLHAIRCTYDLDTKTATNKKIKTEVASISKPTALLYTTITHLYIRINIYLRSILPYGHTETSLHKKIFEYKHCSKFHNLKLYYKTKF